MLDSLDDAMGPQHSPESLISAAAAEASHQAVEELDLAVKGRHVVVELKTASSLPLLKYACGSRVMALSTGQLNTQRVSTSRQWFGLERQGARAAVWYRAPSLLGDTRIDALGGTRPPVDMMLCCVVRAAVLALQLAKMVKRPVMSIISQQLFNFQNGVSLYVQKYPQLVGTRFGELAHLFPDGIVMGLVDTTTGAAR